jgi:hypothetical protein
MKVAIVGAPLSGTTQLTHMLTAAFQQRGIHIDVVDTPEPQSLQPNDWVLLCGLDLEAPSSVDLQIDQRIRQTLTDTGIAYQVVYGQGVQRLDNALFCIGRQAPDWAKQLERPEPPTRWSGPCETCGDGDCEHRLFTSLVKN